MAVVDDLDDRRRAQGVEGQPARIAAPPEQGDDDEGHGDQLGGQPRHLPQLVAGSDASAQAVHGAEPALGHRGVDGADIGAVDPGAARRSVDSPAAPGVGPQPGLPKGDERPALGWPAVGVDAGELNSGVPAVAVQIVGERGGAAQGRHADEHGNHGDGQDGPAAAQGQAKGAEHGDHPHPGPRREKDEECPAGPENGLAGGCGERQDDPGGGADDESSQPPAPDAG